MARGYLTGTESKNMSDGQIALIKRAIDTGAVSFEEYEAALQNTFDCFDKAGISHSASPPSNDRGYPFIAYTYGTADSGVNPVATSCVTKNSDAIESLYQSQPSSRAGADVKFKAAMPVLVPCLRKGGYLTNVPDPTIEQVRQELLIAMYEHPATPSGTDGWSPVACMTSAGI